MRCGRGCVYYVVYVVWVCGGGIYGAWRWWYMVCIVCTVWSMCGVCIWCIHVWCVPMWCVLYVCEVCVYVCVVGVVCMGVCMLLCVRGIILALFYVPCPWWPQSYLLQGVKSESYWSGGSLRSLPALTPDAFFANPAAAEWWLRRCRGKPSPSVEGEGRKVEHFEQIKHDSMPEKPGADDRAALYSGSLLD